MAQQSANGFRCLLVYRPDCGSRSVPYVPGGISFEPDLIRVKPAMQSFCNGREQQYLSVERYWAGVRQVGDHGWQRTEQFRPVEPGPDVTNIDNFWLQQPVGLEYAIGPVTCVFSLRLWAVM